jgi:protein arginine kinase
MVKGELEKVIRSAQRTGLAVRGIYGEGSRAVGDLYQISNQVTLGRSEEQLVGDLAALVPSILEFERRVRGALLDERGDQLRARIEEARELLGTARAIDTDAALTALSMVRLGDLLGLGTSLGQADFGRLVIQVQKGHVQALGPADEDVQPGEMIAPSLRDSWRAAYLRQLFGR